MLLSLAFNSTATDAKMGVPFNTSLYTFMYIKIHSRREKHALNKRNASHFKISWFEQLWKNKGMHLKGILI